MTGGRSFFAVDDALVPGSAIATADRYECCCASDSVQTPNRPGERLDGSTISICKLLPQCPPVTEAWLVIPELGLQRGHHQAPGGD